MVMSVHSGWSDWEYTSTIDMGTLTDPATSISTSGRQVDQEPTT